MLQSGSTTEDFYGVHNIKYKSIAEQVAFYAFALRATIQSYRFSV